VRGGIGGLS